VASYRYTAELKATAAQTSNSGIPSSLRALGGLASAAGIRVPQDSGSVEFMKYIQNLQSRSAAEALSRRADLMHVIFAQEWDANRHRWAEPQGATISAIKFIKGVLGIPVYKWREPDAGRVEDFLERRVAVSEDQKKSIVTISFEHEDPRFAVKLVQALHGTVDHQLRQRSLQITSQNIAYLSRKVATVTVSEHRIALTEALGEQERKRMLAVSTGSFAAEPLDDVSVSFRPTSPRPALYLVGALLGGLVVGVLCVLARAHVQLR
jgi:uncharacterized protein involved in exopolysaccharide biosynthesis